MWVVARSGDLSPLKAWLGVQFLPSIGFGTGRVHGSGAGMLKPASLPCLHARLFDWNELKETGEEQ